MSKKNKAVKVDLEPQGKQIKRVQYPQDFYEKFPAWSFSLCDKDHERWGVCSQPSKVIKKIFDYTVTLEKMGNWGEIFQCKSGRNENTRNYIIPIVNLHKDAQKRLNELKCQEDLLYSLATGGKPRLWGIMDQGVFRIIWVDPDHEICPSLKKHT